MYNMLKDNIGLLFTRPSQPNYNFSVFISSNLVDQCVVGRKSAGAGNSYIAPLYIYPDNKKLDLLYNSINQKEPNIPEIIFDRFTSVFRKTPTPEDIIYYIYGIFYSNIYRETYAEFLKIDFPRVPFTTDYELFMEMGRLGRELGGLHLLKSHQLDNPIAKYQGKGDDDRIRKITYKEEERRIYINKDKYFEGVEPEVWNYHIGGYHVLEQYLKYRKGRTMDEAPRYCKIVTALSKTIELQDEIDDIYPEIEKNLIEFP